MLQLTLWRVRIACWIFKATNTLSEYEILIEFPLRQWFQERALTLCYAYIAGLVKILNWRFVHEQGRRKFLRNVGNFKNFDTVSTSKFPPEVKRETCNSEVPGSDISWDTKYPD